MATRLIKHYFGLHSNSERLLWIIVFAVCCIFGFQFLPMVQPDAKFYDVSGYDNFYYLNSQLRIWYNFRHPVVGIFLYPFVKLRELFNLLGATDTRYIITLLFATINAYSFLFLTRIIYHNCNKNRYKTIIYLAAFFSLAHIMLQTIAIDTFNISLLFMLLAYQILYIDKYRNRLIDNLLFLGICGTTLTNGAFIFLIFLFIEKKKLYALKRFLQASFLFWIVWLGMLGYIVIRYYFADLNISDILRECLIGNTLYFSKTSSISETIFYLWQHFFCEAIAFHSNELLWDTIPRFNSHPIWLLIPIISYLVITIIAFIKTSRLKETHIIIFWWLFCIITSSFYGLAESYICCVHWAFTIPIMMSLVKWDTIKTELTWLIFIGIITLWLFIYNATTFIGFFT